MKIKLTEMEVETLKSALVRYSQELINDIAIWDEKELTANADLCLDDSEKAQDLLRRIMKEQEVSI